MKSVEKDVPRYPQSAELFRFCREALHIKHNQTVKVIDQHVGAILGYDPADCSHWKRGKKNIKSLTTINAIASHLEIDPRIVSDLVSGRTNVEESIQEFKGYGPTQPSQDYYDDLKSKYFREPSQYALNGIGRSFEEVARIDLATLSAQANELIAKAQVTSCPVLLPEILSVLPRITVQSSEELIGESVQICAKDGQWVIVSRPEELKPSTRYLIAKAIGVLILGNLPLPLPLAQDAAPETLKGGKSAALKTFVPDELLEAKANHFAIQLLMPQKLFALALRDLDESIDISQQLAEIFWTTRSLVNIRLKSFIAAKN